MAEGLNFESNATSLAFDGIINEQEEERREQEWWATELTPIFGQIDRIITMLRVYPQGHPLLDTLYDQLIERLNPLFERDDTILFRIESTQTTTEFGHVFYSAERSDKKMFVWYAPYADGVLQFELLKGVTALELQSWLWTINRTSQGTISSDDDTVTLLWELNLDYIKYFAIEGFVDSGQIDTFDKRTEPEAIAVIADAAIDPEGPERKELDQMFNNLNLVHIDLFTKMRIQADARIVTPELRDQDLAYAFRVDDKTVDSLYGEWIKGNDLEYRLIEALLSIIRIAPTSKGAIHAGNLIQSVTNQMIETGQYAAAQKVLSLLNERRGVFAEAEFDPLGELLDRLSDPMQLEALINIMQKNVKKRDDIGELFLELDHSKVQNQVIRLYGDNDRKIVASRQLFDLLQSVTNDSNVTNVWKPENLKKAIFLERVLSELANRDFGAWQPTSRLIRAAISHDSYEVREMALQLNHPCWDDPTLAERYLVPMSQEQDERIRKLAFELLGQRHPKLFRNAIRDTILARKFKGRTHAELRFLMRVFAEHADDAPTYLRQLIMIRGWIGSERRDFAKMAAAVLVELDDTKSIELITSYANSWMTSPKLKTAYKEILSRLQGGALPDPNAQSKKPLKPEAAVEVKSSPLEKKKPLKKRVEKPRESIDVELSEVEFKTEHNTLDSQKPGRDSQVTKKAKPSNINSGVVNRKKKS